MMAQMVTSVIVMEISSFLALTAPPTAIAADTPQIAAPTPRTAPNLLSRPKSLCAIK